MAIRLDHLIVPATDPRAAAEHLAQLLGVRWAASTAAGPFTPVYVSDELTLDFCRTDPPLAVEHYAFRVDEAAFDAILGRLQAAGVDYRSTPHGPTDKQVNTAQGGRIVYWTGPDGHFWEALTVSYARPRD